MKESEIQKRILVALSEYREAAFWPNVIGLMSDRRGFTRRVGIGYPGGADLIGMWTRPDGRAQFVGIEIKSETGRMRESQLAFQAGVTACGGVYAVLRSVEEARQWAEEMRSKS